MSRSGIICFLSFNNGYCNNIKLGALTLPNGSLRLDTICPPEFKKTDIALSFSLSPEFAILVRLPLRPPIGKLICNNDAYELA